MDFKDSGDDGGKKSKNAGKSRNPRNGRGSLVLVLVVLWLIGLTAAVAFFNLPMGAGPGDIENRVADLEKRASQVRKAVPSPDGGDASALAERVDRLEARLGAGGGAVSASAAGSADGFADGNCPCDRILSRLDRLENRTVAAGAPSASPPVSTDAAEAPADETATAPEPAPKKAASTRVARKSVRPGMRKPQPPRDVPGVEVRSFGRDGRMRAPVAPPSAGAVSRPVPAPVPSAPVYSRDGALSEDMQRGYQTESVYDITRRMAPMYGYTEGEMRRVERLAPGAAIYPGNNGGYVGSVLAN